MYARGDYLKVEFKDEQSGRVRMDVGPGRIRRRNAPRRSWYAR